MLAVFGKIQDIEQKSTNSTLQQNVPRSWMHLIFIIFFPYMLRKKVVFSWKKSVLHLKKSIFPPVSLKGPYLLVDFDEYTFWVHTKFL